MWSSLLPHELSSVSLDQECPDPVLVWDLPSALPGLSHMPLGGFSSKVLVHFRNSDQSFVR